MSDVIEVGNDLYEDIERAYKRDEGVVFTWRGFTWRAVRDGDAIKFCKQGSAAPIDVMYGDISIRS